MTVYANYGDYLKAKWAKVQFEIIHRVPFTDAQCQAIDRGRRDFKDPAFAAIQPLLIGRLTPAAYDRADRWSRQQTRRLRLHEAENTPLEQIALVWKKDVGKVSHLFYQGAPYELDYMGGYFNEELLGTLHCDNQFEERPPTPCFSTRIGDLVTEAISGAWVLTATPQQLAIMERAKLDGMAGHTAREELRHTGALTPLEPGGVYMMMEGKQGTWHCSQPTRGDFSGFLYSRTRGPGLKL